MRANFLSCAGLCAGALFLSPSIALANMGNTATTYGLLPTDIASAQALSMFNTQVSTTYYNPAYLAHSTKSELTAGLMHAEHNLKGRQPAVRHLHGAGRPHSTGAAGPQGRSQ